MKRRRRPPSRRGFQPSRYCKICNWNSVTTFKWSLSITLIYLLPFQDRFGETLVRTPTYECCDRIDLSDPVLEKRLKKIEVTVTPPTMVAANTQNATDSNTGYRQNVL